MTAVSECSTFGRHASGAYPTCALTVAEEDEPRGLGSVPVVRAKRLPGGGYDLAVTYLLHDLASPFDGDTAEGVVSPRSVFAIFWHPAEIDSGVTLHFDETSVSFLLDPPHLTTAWRLGSTQKTCAYTLAPPFSFIN